MIKINSSLHSLTLYGSKISFLDRFILSQYTSYIFKDNSKKNVCLMKKECRKTIFVDLKGTDDEIIMGFKSNTRNEVRRAIKDNYCAEQVKDPELFVSFYNSFAKERNLPSISIKDITKWPLFQIYKVVYHDNILCMHVNIFDDELKIARLLYSASARFDETINRKEVGISNRFLHYWEMINFKKQGFYLYDFAGVTDNPKEVELYNISNFKRSFGGEEKEVYFIYSYPLYFLLKCRNIYRSIKNKIVK